MLTITTLLLAAGEAPGLIGFLIWFIFVLLLVGLAWYVLGRFFPALPEPIRTIAIVVIALVLLAVAAKYLGLW